MAYRFVLSLLFLVTDCSGLVIDKPSSSISQMGMVDVSPTALGVVSQRYMAWQEGTIPRAWPDACFMTVTGGAMTLPKQWNPQAYGQCRCGSYLPQKTEELMRPASIRPALNSFRMFSGDLPHKEVVARTNAIDQIISAWLWQFPSPGAQVVFLGAGFDGRAYSLPGIEKATVFELDLAGTQQFKSTLVQQCGMTKRGGDQVHYVPLDLDAGAGNPYHKLIDHPNFAAGKPTLFLTEAVMQYVGEEDNKADMKILANLAMANPASRVLVQAWRADPVTASNIKQAVSSFEDVKFIIPAGPGADSRWFGELGWGASTDNPVYAKAIQSFYQSAAVYDYLQIFRATENVPRSLSLENGEQA